MKIILRNGLLAQRVIAHRVSRSTSDIARAPPMISSHSLARRTSWFTNL